MQWFTSMRRSYNRREYEGVCSMFKRMLPFFALILLMTMVLPWLPYVNAAPIHPVDEPPPTVASMHDLQNQGPPVIGRGCGRGATPIEDYENPSCCVSGYVYLNGTPVQGAEVTISANGETATLQTQSALGIDTPHFYIDLDLAPLNVRPGDTVEVTALAGGQTKTVTFVAAEGGQQIDVVLPQNSVEAAWVRGIPPSRTAAAYDTKRQRLVLLAGFRDDIVSETWEWDGIKWSQMTPFSTPPARTRHEIVYDKARQRVVLFGGWGGDSQYFNDTWEWDGSTWVERTPTVSPPPLERYALAYDEARQRVVLFGGYGPDGYLTDTWEWDGSNWTKLTPEMSPPERYGHAMAYDAARQRVVLFGGQKDSEGLNDTWEWDGTNWERQFPANAPTPRYGHAMAYDAVRQRVMLFGGIEGQLSKNDTWEWDGINWVQENTTQAPFASHEHSLFYNTERQQIMLFGSVYVPFLWTWDRSDWTELFNPLITSARTGAALAYESSGNTLLFGGRNGSTTFDTTYRWSSSTWEELSPSTTPPARYGHSMARNSDGSSLLMFGGIGTGNTYLNDTWLWNGSNWASQSSATNPATRANYSLTYDQIRNVWVLFGGQNSSGYLGDTWEFNGSTWTRRTPSTSPPPRANATLTYDPDRNVAVLVGGQTNSGLLDDVWEWNGTNWSEVTPAQRLTARTGHGAAYDSTQNVVVVAGGTSNGGELADTWEWNGSFWRQRSTNPDMPGMYNFGMDYDAANDQLVVAGGENSSGVVEGVYLHRVQGTPTEASPIATISRVQPRDARQGVDTITFVGRGADADSSDVISAYRWTYLDANSTPVEFGAQATVSMSASNFPLGAVRIRLEVQDNEGTWSQPVEETIFIRDANGGISGEQTWTLLIYAAADNNLDPWMGENPDLNGMLYRLQTAGAQARVNVGVLYDGPGANDTRRYVLDETGAWSEQSQPEARMDEMETLRDFVTWGYDTFPTSDYYVLSLVDHANGVVGFAQDTSSPDDRPFLTPIEMRSALSQATDSGSRKIDVLHYDGCSFGLYETAAIADGLAHYIIASPTTGWGVFAYKQYREIAGSATDPRDYAITAAQAYADWVDHEALAYTISVFDMAQFDTLDASISALGDSLLTYVNADPDTRRDELKNVRTAAQKYDSGGLEVIRLDTEDVYVDIIDLSERIRTQVNDTDVDAATTAVIDAVQGNSSRNISPFVIYESHATSTYTAFDPGQQREVTFDINLDNAHGIGLFYPPRKTTSSNSTYVDYIEHRLFDVTRDSGWTRFIGNALPTQGPDDPPPMPNNELIVPLLESEEGFPALDEQGQQDQQIFLPLISR
jgi:hypothetical protein